MNTQTQTAERPELLKMVEVAQMLGVSRVTAWKVAKSGNLKPVHIPGLGTPRYRRADIDALIRGEEPQ
jgi:predicted DNA-binding transcriptional regulator AlpA